MANTVAKVGAGITVVVTVAMALLLPPPKESSKTVDYQQRCALALAFHTTYVPIAARKAGLPSMFFANGEAERPKWVALEYAKQGIGIADSLHTRKLAMDKHLFINGVYAERTSQHTFSGIIWEAIGPSFGLTTRWGGRFTRQDGNHYECVPKE